MDVPGLINAECALRVSRAVQVYAAEANPEAIDHDSEPPSDLVAELLSDMISDLLHYGRRLGIDADAIVSPGLMNFLAEVKEEAEVSYL